MAGRELTHDVPVDDDRGHVAGPEESWQESFAVTWYDPATRVGAHFHTGLQRNRGLADYWSHIVVDGEVAAAEHSIAAPLPAGDYPDLSLGPLEIRGLEPLRSYRVRATYDEIDCDVVYEAYPGPVLGFGLDRAGASVAKGHFESHGTVHGVIRVGGREVAVAGLGFHDHSWGPRDYDLILSLRNLMINFGPDLRVQTFDCTTAVGRSVVGYVLADGLHQPVVDIDAHTEIADDGWTPLAIDMVLWTDEGRGYHVTGTADCSTYNVCREDVLRGVGYLRCELGGRVGGGQIWVGDGAKPTAWQLDALRTDF